MSVAGNEHNQQGNVIIRNIDENGDTDFIQAVSTKAFKNAFRTTVNPNDDDLSKIYIGGYKPIFDDLTKPAVDPLDLDENLLTASISTQQQLQQKSKILLIDGKQIPYNDIVAKTSIPYPKPLRARFINATQTDQVINTVFNLITMYIFNVARKTALRPTEDFRAKNNREVLKILNGIISPEIQEECINYMGNVDRYSHVWTEFGPLSFLHMMIYGIGGFFRELMNNSEIINEDLDINIPIGTPAVLKHLDPYFFEKVYQNRKSFDYLLLEYSDPNYTLIDDEIFNNRKIGKNIIDEFAGWKQLIIRDPNEDKDYDRKNLLLPLNQTVLFKNNKNIAPNLDFWGTSKIFNILPLSEINREIHYNILPSINKVQSQGSCIITTKIRNEQKLKAFISQVEEGTNYIVTNTEGFTVQNIELNVDLPGITTERFDNVKQMLMGLNYPSPLINFENVTNRATMNTVLQFFQNTSLETLRDTVSTTMSDQWYIPLTVFFFNNVLGQTTKDGQSKELKKYRFIDLKLKILTEFEKIDFDLFTEKLTALNPITFLTEPEKREHIGRDPYPLEDEEAENVEKVNDQLQDVDEIQKDPNRNIADKNKEIEELKAIIRELMGNIKDPQVAKIMSQKMDDIIAR